MPYWKKVHINLACFLPRETCKNPPELNLGGKRPQLCFSFFVWWVTGTIMVGINCFDQFQEIDQLTKIHVALETIHWLVLELAILLFPPFHQSQNASGMKPVTPLIVAFLKSCNFLANIPVEITAFLGLFAPHPCIPSIELEGWATLGVFKLTCTSLVMAQRTIFTLSILEKNTSLSLDIFNTFSHPILALAKCCLIHLWGQKGLVDSSPFSLSLMLNHDLWVTGCSLLIYRLLLNSFLKLGFSSLSRSLPMASHLLLIRQLPLQLIYIPPAERW